MFFTVAINSENYDRLFQNYPIISVYFRDWFQTTW